MQLREPHIADSAQIYSLVDNCKPLDLNSRYLYILIASHFRHTSIVAEEDKKIVGMISGYLLPEDPTILFIWQVAVASEMRGKRLAFAMLESLLTRESLQKVTSLHTTVTPSNSASHAFFARSAKLLGAELEILPGFDRDLFGGDAHESEDLLCIGPIVNSTQKKG